MKKGLFSVVAVGCVLGCSAPDNDGEKAPSTVASPNEPAVGQVKQRSQFADATVFNIVDPGASPFLTVNADGDPVTVQIYYIGDKTTDAGHFPATAVLAGTLDLASDDTRSFTINTAHAAFAGGYGSLLVDAVGVSPTTVFQTFMTYNMATNANVTQSVGGSVFAGTSYRIPVFRGTTKVVLALTNQSDFQYDVLIAHVGGIESKTITLVPLTTYKFDSSVYGWVWPAANAPAPHSLQIFTQAGGTVAVSGYVQAGTNKYRVAPVKAASYL
jgi:hypothetical protein